jgi:hypothetical protein
MVGHQSAAREYGNLPACPAPKDPVCAAPAPAAAPGPRVTGPAAHDVTKQPAAPARADPVTPQEDDMTTARSRLHDAAVWVQRQRWQRWVVRAPIGMFRARLGFVFGSRLLMIERRAKDRGAGAT